MAPQKTIGELKASIASLRESAATYRDFARQRSHAGHLRIAETLMGFVVVLETKASEASARTEISATLASR